MENSRGLEPSLDSWRAWYKEMPTRSRYMHGRRRLSGPERSDMENRMPLLKGQSMVSMLQARGKLPAHIDERVEMFSILVGVFVVCWYGRHLGSEVFDSNDVIVCVRLFVASLGLRGRHLVAVVIWWIENADKLSGLLKYIILKYLLHARPTLCHIDIPFPGFTSTCTCTVQYNKIK